MIFTLTVTRSGIQLSWARGKARRNMPGNIPAPSSVSQPIRVTGFMPSRNAAKVIR